MYMQSLGADSTESMKSRVTKFINYLTFDFVVPLLQLGNERPLMQSDLYPLENQDSSIGVYKTFKAAWRKQLKGKKDTESISLVETYISAFGFPFFAAGDVYIIFTKCSAPVMYIKILTCRIFKIRL